MHCPRCKRESSRRSRRRGLHEYILSLVGVYPWRCGNCQRRFYATLVPLRLVFYAHCPRCGNFNLERASGAARKARFGFAAGLPFVSALRCNLCRLNFVSLRPLRALPAEAESTPERPAPTNGEEAL